MRNSRASVSIIIYIRQEDEGISFGDCKVNALLYADDVVLLGGSPDQLQRLLHTLGQWCSDNYGT